MARGGSFTLAVLRWAIGGCVVGGFAGFWASERYPLTAAYFFGLLTGFILLLFRGATGGSVRQIIGAVIGMLAFSLLFGVLVSVFGALPEKLHSEGVVVPEPVPFAAVLVIFFGSLLIGAAWSAVPSRRKPLRFWLAYFLASVLFSIFIVVTYPLLAGWEDRSRAQDIPAATGSTAGPDPTGR